MAVEFTQFSLLGCAWHKEKFQASKAPKFGKVYFIFDKPTQIPLHQDSNTALALHAVHRGTALTCASSSQLPKSIYTIKGEHSGEQRRTQVTRLAHRHSAGTSTAGMWAQASWPWTITTEVPKASGHQTPPEAMLTQRLSEFWRQGLWACIPVRFPGDVAAAGLGTTLRATVVEHSAFL